MEGRIVERKEEWRKKERMEERKEEWRKERKNGGKKGRMQERN
jgi:hypothetical protein